MINNTYGIKAEDLYSSKGLEKIDQAFLDYTNKLDPATYKNLLQYRITARDDSDFIITLAPMLEQFLVELFQIRTDLENFKEAFLELDYLYDIKRNFFQRESLGRYKKEEVTDAKSINISDIELARKIKDLQKNPIANQIELEELRRSLAHQYYSGKKSVIFSKPEKIDYSNLVKYETSKNVLKFPDSEIIDRKGFNLTEHGVGLDRAIDQSKYCIYCHKRDKDSCSKGFEPIKTNPLNNTLSGCPLKQKISEMNLLFAEKFPIGALATIMIDNPLVAVTGNRICNDCQKACIFQQQAPVEIPQIESHILDTILNFPYGVEIYLLLAQWNPLKPAEYLPAALTGKTIFVSGLGPSGFAISHYMLQSGHDVHAVDGLKIEPMNFDYTPIKEYSSIKQTLEVRKIIGFGGVVEYGITARFDKNKLYLIRLLLERNKNFNYQSGVRLGSTITVDEIFDYGYDHLAICHGAGDPNILNNPNALAKGVRIASDFLMNLQLSTAQQKTSLSNLQIRLPIVVVGSGLTAIDSATEAQCYYLKQIESFTHKYNEIGKELPLNEEEQIIAQEFLNDYKKKPNELDATTILYRKKIQDSPAYRTNHEEIAHAFKEGIHYRENIEILEFILDEFKHISHLRIRNQNSEEEIIPAKTVLLAVGTKPNNVIAKESPDLFSFENKFISTLYNNSVLAKTTRHQNKISIFGDMHKQYTGSVVKALASAKNGYHEINKNLPKTNSIVTLDFKNEFNAEVRKISKLAEEIYEISVYAPALVKRFKAGQFFRLQNYLSNSEEVSKDNITTSLSTEPIAASGSDVDIKNSILKLVIIERGSSTKLIKNLRIGEKINLMGPAGEHLEIAPSKTMLFIGSLIGNAVLLPMMREARLKNCKVYYICLLKNENQIYYKNEVESCADEVKWHFSETDILKDFNLETIDQIVIAGSRSLAEHLSKDLSNFKNIQTLTSSPMQCMMKEICAQCLQKHIDPKTGEISYIYSCQNQIQNIFHIDWESLESRMSQNSLLEKLSSKWLDYCFQN